MGAQTIHLAQKLEEPAVSGLNSAALDAYSGDITSKAVGKTQCFRH